MTLQEIFCAKGTDKGTYHEYGPDYEEYLNPESIKTLLEIGVWTGCSMLAWHEWLPKAEIWGVDIEVEPKKIKSFSRIHHVIGNITDPTVVAKLPEQFDVIIDDGSHTSWDITGAFDLLWPRLISGGWYIVEDLFVNPGLEKILIAKVEITEHHFKKHHGEILFMRKK